MENVKRYEFEGEVIEVPLRWDDHLKQYVEDYCKQPGHTPAGRPILLTIEDACPYADMVDDDPASIDCGSCHHYHQFSGSLLGVCNNEKRRKKTRCSRRGNPNLRSEEETLCEND